MITKALTPRGQLEGIVRVQDMDISEDEHDAIVAEILEPRITATARERAAATEIKRLRAAIIAITAASEDVMSIAGPELWENSEYFRAADRLATLLNLQPNA